MPSQLIGRAEGLLVVVPDEDNVSYWRIGSGKCFAMKCLNGPLIKAHSRLTQLPCIISVVIYNFSSVALGCD